MLKCGYWPTWKNYDLKLGIKVALALWMNTVMWS